MGILEILKTNVLAIQFAVLIGLVLVDLLVAVAISLAGKTFSWSKFLQYLKQNILAYVIVWAALAGIVKGFTYLDVNDTVIASLAILVDVVYATVYARVSQSIFGHLSKLGVKSG